MNADLTLHLESVQPDDFAGIQSMFADVFERTVSAEFLHWKYAENPAGSVYGAVARFEENQAMAACYGNIPLSFKIGKRQMTGAQAVDAIVLPKARRQGIWGRMAEETFARMDADGIVLNYALPNPVSMAGFIQRLGWDEVGAIPRHVRILDVRRAVGTGGAVRNLLVRLQLSAIQRLYGRKRYDVSESAVQIDTVTKFDERFDELWQKVGVDWPIAVVRNSAYLNWRYCDNPDRDYVIFSAESEGELKGFVVMLQQIDNSADTAALLEFIVSPDVSEVGAELLHAVERYARQSGAASIHCWMLPHHTYYLHMLQNAGYMHLPVGYVPGSLRYSTPLIIRTHPHVSLPTAPHSLENWFISMGDHDYY